MNGGIDAIPTGPRPLRRWQPRSGARRRPARARRRGPLPRLCGRNQLRGPDRGALRGGLPAATHHRVLRRGQSSAPLPGGAAQARLDRFGEDPRRSAGLVPRRCFRIAREAALRHRDRPGERPAGDLHHRRPGRAAARLVVHSLRLHADRSRRSRLRRRRHPQQLPRRAAVGALRSDPRRLREPSHPRRAARASNPPWP